ncbi:MAG: hypothetical protein JWO91_2583 [Acidobacteriaceae bacterium]|nr:hypothetical protein [Acidobacteriaceae bacterium]
MPHRRVGAGPHGHLDSVGLQENKISKHELDDRAGAAALRVIPRAQSRGSQSDATCHKIAGKIRLVPGYRAVTAMIMNNRAIP